MCKIILVMLALVALAGCRSERHVTSHEEARFQRAVLDSTATRVDSLARRDSVWLSWMAGEVSLEVDSIDWHFAWDSAGRVAGVSGRRLVSRHSSVAGQKAAAAAVEETREESRRQRAIVDSTSALRVEDKRVETKAGWRPGWLEIAGGLVVLLLAGCGVLYLRGLTERWKDKGR